MQRFKPSMRFKVFGLVAGAVTVSLFCFIYLGNSLVVRDKTSYIYDFNLTQVAAVTSQLQSQLERNRDFLSLASKIPNSASSVSDSVLKSMGIETLFVLRSAENRFQITYKRGSHITQAEKALNNLGWTPNTFSSSSFQLGYRVDGLIPIGGRGDETSSNGNYFFALMSFAPIQVNQQESPFGFFVTDEMGNILVSKTTKNTMAESELPSLLTNLGKLSFESGVTDWGNQGTEYVVAYHRIPKTKLLVTGTIPKKVAFASAQALVNRSLVLGVSILFIALGFALFFVRTLTQYLRELWRATQGVAKGDFSQRVDIQGLSNDELGDLATSFNAMASKIDDLISQTAENARMEKELETAKETQRRYFPAKGFQRGKISLTGRLLPAAECAGDWWHYAEIDDILVGVIGDVTGHGVASALTTAAAHSAFLLALDKLRAKPLDISGTLKYILQDLNSAIFGSTHGEATMTLFAVAIDLKTGKLGAVNAGHCSPFLIKGKTGEAETIQGEKCESLGTSASVEVKVELHKLEPGDALFFYTDGVLEPRESDGKRMSRLTLRNTCVQLVKERGPKADALCESFVQSFLKFYGGEAVDRPDDVTLMVAAYQKSA